ncbi:hypothetical protein I316_01504 [Kwoniella heveanensis BCC8398]|uniref:ARID domain-containing protein n=1 Tax=Kwoniella heveanensis BCC8398 TaxID=1296120 RepID=A0A1B9H0U9_9TREE|nr:hypothetical protein I316_01504 [Kwoniella heveanensis BCC8398]
MATPTSTSLSIPPQPNNNNLGRISPANALSHIPGSSQSPNAFLPQSQHAGPSSYPRPPPPHAMPPQQSVAGPSRPPPHQFQQQYASMNGLPGQQQPQPGNLQTGFNAADPSLHARLLMAAQQQAQAAAAANAAKTNGSGGGNAGGGGGGGNGGGGSGGDGRSTPQAAIPPDLAALANNIQGGNREAIMKQLQALQNSQAQRAKLGLANPQLAGQGSIANGSAATPQSAASPANITAPSPIIAPSPMNATSPANQSHFAQQTQNQPSNPQHADYSQQSGPGVIPNEPQHQSQGQAGVNGNDQGVAGGQMSQQQRDFLAAQQDRMRVAQNVQILRQSSQQQISQPPTPQGGQTGPGQLSMPQNAAAQQSQPPMRPPGQPGPGQPGVRPPPNPGQQRLGFINSLAQFYKHSNQPLPTAIFNGERDGYFKVGDGWVDVVELLMAVMKSGGIMNVMQQPADSALWRQLITAKNIPNPLPRPLIMPKLHNTDPNAPPQLTTNPVQYVITGYFAWLHAFESHMTKQRQHMAQRQQLATGRPPLPPGASLPANLSNGMPGYPAAAGPMHAASPIASTSNGPTPGAMVPSASSSMSSYTPTAPSPANPVDTVPPPVKKPRGKQGGRKKKDANKAVPPPIQTEPPVTTTPDVPQTPGTGKKRKRKDKGDKAARSAENSAPSTPVPGLTQSSFSTPVALAERPPTPKRARFKVEYKPVHKVQTTVGAWDSNMVAATFAKNSLTQGTRPIHDLTIVDMEAILMSLRSRLPHELGYAITVLSMLSMPHPEESIQGLPLHHLRDILEEILELIAEAAFGEEGWEAWRTKYEQAESKLVPGDLQENDVATATRNTSTLNTMSFAELERIGRDLDYSVDEVSADPSRPRDQTGGQTDIVLAGMNLLRNFSMFQENQALMASFPALFELLATVSDARLCRMPGQDDLVDVIRPYSVIELARVRRDAVSILTNVGSHINLRSVSSQSTLATFRLLSTFLNSGFESTAAKEPIYGTLRSVSTREIPPPATLSVNRALDAFCGLASTDSNREVLGLRVPASEQVKLFESLIKLLPLDRRQFEAMHTIEESLVFCEYLSLSLYSLVFLAPASIRTIMRSVPGAVAILTRVIFDTALQKADFKTNPFGILCRRLCETLGVLNGTVSANGQVEGGMSFSAGGIDGHGWKFASKRVEKGWLANLEEQVLGVVTGVRGMDLPTFNELEGMCWGSE